MRSPKFSLNLLPQGEAYVGSQALQAHLESPAPQRSFRFPVFDLTRPHRRAMPFGQARRTHPTEDNDETAAN